MASTLQSAVETVLLNNYVSLALVTAIGYDYILTFSDEIEYIWKKPWTKVSTLFILVRYVGLFNIMISSICDILNFFDGWSYLVFIGAADLAMILRVWALYNRSRIILGTLLTLYAAEIFSKLVWCIFFSIQGLSGATTLFDFSFCLQLNGPPDDLWIEILNSAQIALGTLMCLLVIVQFVREALQMYKATKQIRLNRYMNLLAKEGMIYFLAILVMSLLSILNTFVVPEEEWAYLSDLAQYVPPYTLAPRFILSLRALYARDLQGRRGSDLDSAFGFSSESVDGVVASAILFADAGQDKRLEKKEEIQVVEVTGEDRYSAGTSSA